MSKQIRINKIINCHQCPNISSERTPSAGFAIDYYCNAVSPRKIVAGYVEWNSEKRKDHDFPDFCPLESQENEKSSLSKFEEALCLDKSILDQTKKNALLVISTLFSEAMISPSQFGKSIDGGVNIYYTGNYLGRYCVFE
jgi:hypothetical protein